MCKSRMRAWSKGQISVERRIVPFKSPCLGGQDSSYMCSLDSLPEVFHGEKQIKIGQVSIPLSSLRSTTPRRVGTSNLQVSMQIISLHCSFGCTHTYRQQ